MQNTFHTPCVKIAGPFLMQALEAGEDFVLHMKKLESQEDEMTGQ